MRKTNQAGIDLIKSSEGLRLHAYQDGIGVWTIGYGHTRGVHRGMTITPEDADQYLVDDLSDAERIVESNVTIDLTDNQFSALVSFVFNVGPGKKGVKDGFVQLKSGRPSTMLRLLNAGDALSAADQFLGWDKAGGKIEPGLVKRRKAERGLFLAPDEPEMIPVPDVPEPAPDTVATNKTTIIEKTTNVVSGLAGNQQVKDIASQAVGKLATGASTIAGGAGAVAAADGATSHNFWLIILAIVLALIGAAFVFYLLWHRSQKERLAAQINSDPSKADIRFVK